MATTTFEELNELRTAAGKAPLKRHLSEAKMKAEIEKLREAIPDPDDLVPLRDVCERLDIDPRKARAKLRKHLQKERYARYEFRRDELPEIEKILT